jgi:hypothetical protein
MDKPDTTPQPDKYDELIAMLRKDPDFHRLPLPEFVRKRFDIPLVCNELSIKTATAKAFGSLSS